MTSPTATKAGGEVRTGSEEKAGSDTTRVAIVAVGV